MTERKVIVSTSVKPEMILTGYGCSHPGCGFFVAPSRPYHEALKLFGHHNQMDHFETTRDGHLTMLHKIGRPAAELPKPFTNLRNTWEQISQDDDNNKKRKSTSWRLF